MRGIRVFSSVCAVVAALGTSGLARAQQIDSAGIGEHRAKMGRFDPVLVALKEASEAEREAMASELDLSIEDGKVTVELASSDPDGMRAALAEMGAEEVSVYGSAMSARVPLEELDRMMGQPGLRVARRAVAIRGAGLVESQGVAALRVDRVGPDLLAQGRGQGIRVGIISDSFHCNPAPDVPGAPTTTAEQDVANGEIPADFIVLDNGRCPGTDEGRAMAQLIHDVAPDSVGAFHTSGNAQASFANAIRRLVREAGSDVIVDDILIAFEPMFQDGPIAQAATEATRQGVSFFSAAGNSARMSYEAEFRPVDIGGGMAAHDFAPGVGVDTLPDFILRPNASGVGVASFSFQWDEPFFTVSGGAGSASDLDMLFFDTAGDLLPDCVRDRNPLLFPTTDGFPPVCQNGSIVNTGGDAVELIRVRTFIGPVRLKLGFVRTQGPDPSRVKFVPFVTDGSRITFEFDTRSPTAFGHTNAPGVVSVGAAAFDTTAAFGDPRFGGACLPACLEPFSAAGGVEILFDPQGNRLAAPERRLKPNVTGPDGGNTTFFGSDSELDDDDGDGRASLDDGENASDELPNFFGTSAAAPHVAAVAALMLDASEPRTVDANDGTGQRLCVQGRQTVLVPKEIADAVLRLAPDSIRVGFCLTPAAIQEALESTALDMRRREDLGLVDVPNPVGFDFDSGAGFVDAEAAIRRVARP